MLHTRRKYLSHCFFITFCVHPFVGSEYFSGFGLARETTLDRTSLITTSYKTRTVLKLLWSLLYNKWTLVWVCLAVSFVSFYCFHSGFYSLLPGQGTAVCVDPAKYCQNCKPQSCADKSHYVVSYDWASHDHLIHSSCEVKLCGFVVFAYSSFYFARLT